MLYVYSILFYIVTWSFDDLPSVKLVQKESVHIWESSTEVAHEA